MLVGIVAYLENPSVTKYRQKLGTNFYNLQARLNKTTTINFQPLALSFQKSAMY